MKYTYAAIDIETSSLHPSKGQLLELGVVIDDLSVKVDRADLEEYLEQLPKFHCYIKHPNVVGEHFAVSMHNRIWQVLAKEPVSYYFQEETNSIEDYNYRLNNNLPIVVEHGQVFHYFRDFLDDNNLLDLNESGYPNSCTSLVIAGKNVAGFDIPFLSTLYGFNKEDNFNDFFKFAHRTIDPAMLYLQSTDNKPPSLNECLSRAGINKTVDHTAVGDALDVIRCLKMSTKLYE
jgi:oligoribonuclease